MIRNKLGSLISTKPCVFLVNLTQDDFVKKKNKWLPKIHAWIQEKAPGTSVGGSPIAHYLFFFSLIPSFFSGSRVCDDPDLCRV